MLSESVDQSILISDASGASGAGKLLMSYLSFIQEAMEEIKILYPTK